MEINGILYFRRSAVTWKYPDLVHGQDKDFWIGNMNRNPESPTYGEEKVIWNTVEYPKPTDEQMLVWYNEFNYLEKRRYDKLEEQLDALYRDIDNGKVGKTGEFYLMNKAVKDANPKPN